MKLIIDISEGHYEPFKIGKYTIVGGLRGNGKTLISALCMAIANATPLEKHDAEVIKETVASVWGKPPYIELLDKIRVELHATAEMHEDDVYYLREEWIDEIIDKYKKGNQESEEQG